MSQAITKRVRITGTNTFVDVIIDRGDAQFFDSIDWHVLKVTHGSKRGGFGLYVRSTSRPHRLLHRMLLNAPSGSIVDHANRNTLDNRRSNLRFATKSQSATNRSFVVGRSGYRGVYPREGGRRWFANLQVNGKRIAIGSFGTPQEAARAYNEAAKKHRGEFAVLNPI